MNLERIISLIFIGGTLALGVGCNRPSPQPRESVQATRPPPVETPEDKLRSTVLSYLSQPQFSGSDMLRQITGTRAKLEVFNLDEEMIYFSLPQQHYASTTTAQLSNYTERVEFGKTQQGQFIGGVLHLGRYQLDDQQSYFFRFPARDFKVNPHAVVRTQFPGNVTYTLSMQELQDFLENKTIYGGHLNAQTGTERGYAVIVANHGAYVAKKGEQSLTRLVSTIIGKSKTGKKVKAQKLLEFIASRIKYDEGEALANAETLKRPNEVLLSKSSDCSGKAILYASLLEQTDIDYRLVYYENHIAVAVEGNFPAENGLSFAQGSKKFFIAETTIPGFKIGKSQVRGIDLSLRGIRYLQRPGPKAGLYTKEGKLLPFI